MTPEEKEALMQFMGTVYGESKKHDDMLVGQSTNLRPKSGQIKQQFEQVLRSPVHANNPQPQPRPQPQQPPPAPPVVTPEQAQQELAQAMEQQVVDPKPTPQAVEPAVDPNQMEFDLSEPTKLDKLIELIQEQNKILLEIRDNSIKSNYGTKRAKNKKPQ